ncbi:putative choline transporter, neither null mutation nor overexpression affects choline transport [Onygenales sp. PD_40]|nr:putative choline transporter, neither null mutation nor overexpression affects choline transport [Onygenales sp. PD_40]KAK2789390.1 putative choline transporter, neither null mutation nor overexpression affects choline transport [Onygenales sp. PD_12]
MSDYSPEPDPDWYDADTSSSASETHTQQSSAQTVISPTDETLVLNGGWFRRFFQRSSTQLNTEPRALQFEEAFGIENPQYHDAWAGALFLITVAGFAALSGVVMDRYARGKDFQGHGVNDATNTIALDLNTISLITFIVPVSLSCSTIFFQLFLFFSEKFIWVAGILNVAFGLGTGLFYLARKQWAGGGTFLGFGLFALVYFMSWIPRIPYSSVLLRTSATVNRRHMAVTPFTLIGGFLVTIFMMLFSVTLITAYVAFEPNTQRSNSLCAVSGCSRKIAVLLTSFITFAGYWITEWMKNTIHTTVAGVFGSWYYHGGNSTNMPKAPIRGALKRSLTYSFGSICLGSLLVPPVNMLRQLCSISKHERTSRTNIIGAVGSRVLRGVMDSLRCVIRYFNRYAFCHIALYGDAYVPSAKATWQTMEDRGIDALVNDSLVGAALSMGSLFVAYFSAFLSYVYLQYTSPDYNNHGQFTSPVMAYAFICGFQISKVFMAPVSSGVDSLFVSIARDPDVLLSAHPDLWESLLVVYPRAEYVLQA